jgi:hypothetical protein
MTPPPRSGTGGGVLIDLGATELTQPRDGGLLLPHADQWPRQRPVRHLLNLVRQPATTATAGATRQQIRHHALTRTPPRDQHIHLTPGNPQLSGGCVHGRQPHRALLRQPPDHPGPPHRGIPHLGSRHQDTPLNHRTLDQPTTPTAAPTPAATVVQTTALSTSFIAAGRVEPAGRSTSVRRAA